MEIAFAWAVLCQEAAWQKAGTINNLSAPIPPTPCAAPSSCTAQTLQALGTDYCGFHSPIIGQEYDQEVAMRRTQTHSCAEFALCIENIFASI